LFAGISLPRGSEHLFYSSSDYLINNQLGTHNFCDNFACNVILRWAKPSTHYDGIAAIKSKIHSSFYSIPIVTNFCLVVTVDSG
jgi:hypothetical protein